jgi:hypothetical protein
MRILLATALIAFATACSESPTEQADNVRVEVKVARPEIHVGDTISIAVSVTNISVHEIEIQVNRCPAWFQVMNGSTRVAPTQEICTADSQIRKLAAHETFTQNYVWNGRTTVIGIDGATGGAPSAVIPTGDYTVAASAFAPIGTAAVPLRIVP